MRHDASAPRLLAVSAAALLASDLPPAPHLVGGLLPRQSLAVLGGPPKVWKSFAALNLALARAVGQPWLGFPTSPGRTLLLQAEIPAADLQDRLRRARPRLAAPLPDDNPLFVTNRKVRLDEPAGLRACRDVVAEVRPDLLIIDPLARYFSGDENSARDVGRLIGALDELIEDLGVAVLLIHHTAKPSMDGRRGGLRLRGSSALFAAADSLLMMDRAAPHVRLTAELRHGPEPPALLLSLAEDLWLEPATSRPELARVADLALPDGLSWTAMVGTIQSTLGVGHRTAQRYLRQTVDAGLLVRDTAGRYRTTARSRPQAVTAFQGCADPPGSAGRMPVAASPAAARAATPPGPL